ncbi:MAG TPA: sulfatase, partial [Thermoanaerobaculia bacterium]|nr:sulfatase [Thermoanaerobaculia bacterium]
PVLLLTIDTLRADRLNAYGYAARTTSPHLDALLAQGVLFEQAQAPRAATWPSLGTVLTGLYPTGHGAIENGYGIADEVTTLGEALSAAGYRTGAFLSNMCQANHQGFDDFACSGGSDGKTVRRALEWIDGLPDDGRPWFLWVHLFGAHGPYYNGGDLAARELDPGYEGPIGPKKWQLDRVMEEPLALAERDVVHLDALYDAAVIGSDRLAGMLLDGLARRGELDRALTVFAADHGEELYDHNGYLYHACSVYQSTLHVPLGVVAPGVVPEGGRVPQTVELADVLPTVLALLGVEPPEDLHGVSLVRYLERPGEGGGAGRPAFSEYGSTAIRTVVADGWKLIVNPDRHQPYCVAGAPEGHYPIAAAELYHLAVDPEERRDLAGERPDRVAALAGLVERRFSGLSRRAERQDVPEDLREELRALGYVAN